MKAGLLSPRRLLGVCAPLLLWAIHLVAVYSLQGLACSGQADGVLGGDSRLRLLLVVLSITLLALVTGQAWRAGRMRRATTPGQTAAFLPAATLLAAVVAAIAIVFTTVPILMLAPCE